LIKHPPLLILDEPTQGLDEIGRHLVLAFLERLARLERTTLLFVTHRTDEHLPLFRRHLTFVPAEREHVRFAVNSSVMG
jgi:molybdate transport system ATP-binding protein